MFALLVMSNKSQEWFSLSPEFSLRHEYSFLLGQTMFQALKVLEPNRGH